MGYKPVGVWVDDVAVAGGDAAAEERGNNYEQWGNPRSWSVRGSRGRAWGVRGL